MDSGEEDVQSYGTDKDRDGEGFGPLPPGEMRGLRLWGKRTDKADEFRFRFRLRQEAHDDGDDEVGREGEDGAPEILGHVAGVMMNHGKPPALDARVRFDR